MARKVKVLCFHPALAPYRVDFFNLLAQQVNLEVVFLMENLKNQQLDQKSVRAAATFKYRMLTKGFEIKGRLWRWGIRRIIREVKPDVVMGYEASPITMMLCGLRMLRVVRDFKLWTHMDEAAVTIRSRKGVRAWMRNWVLRHVDGVMVPSEEAALAYREMVVSGQSLVVCGPKFSVVPIVHDTAAIRKNAKFVIEAGKVWRAELPKSWQKVMLFVGRLAPVKNLSWLISQMPNLPREVGFVIVGDGSERVALKALVKARHLEGRIRFDGKHEGDALYARMSAADFFVLPSVFEPYGAVVPEVMQWGVPCVVGDHCGCRVLIEDGVNGYVYKHNDAETFRNSLEKVLTLKRDGKSMLSCDLKDAVADLVSVIFGNDGK